MCCVLCVVRVVCAVCCACGVWCVLVRVVVVIVVVWCVVVFGVWCGTQKKPPCVDSKRPRVYRHHARMCPKHARGAGTHGGRFERTHGGFLDGHTACMETGREEGGKGGVHRQFCLPRLVHVVITCSRGSPKETSGSSPLSV